MSVKVHWVLRSVVEAFTESNPDDRIDISDDEFWHALAVLKTVSETLHEVGEPKRRPNLPSA